MSHIPDDRWGGTDESVIHKPSNMSCLWGIGCLRLKASLRMADSVLPFTDMLSPKDQIPLHTLGARCPGNQWEHLGYIVGSGSFFPQCIHQTHLGYIWNVTSTYVQHLSTK